MKIKTMFLSAAVAAAVCLPAVADDHEGESDPMISIMEVTYKHGHGMKFRDAMMAYMECYAENGGEEAWSAWAPVDGAPNEMWFVSSMTMWAELDADDPGDEACWSEHGTELTSHVSDVNRRMYKRMGDWSGDAGEYSVVKLHNFRVDDGEAFRGVVGEITDMMKDADYEHMGTWYGAVSQQRWAADYFVVEHFENFAAMDEDRPGPDGIMKDAIGEEATSEMWDRMDGALADMEPYWNNILRRVESLSHSPGED
jgi:hypothetical protein